VKESEDSKTDLAFEIVKLEAKCDETERWAVQQSYENKDLQSLLDSELPRALDKCQRAQERSAFLEQEVQRMEILSRDLNEKMDGSRTRIGDLQYSLMNSHQEIKDLLVAFQISRYPLSYFYILKKNRLRRVNRI
jgi:hypothetical protein